MCSSGTTDVIDMIPNENVLPDSGVDIDQTVEPNVMSFDTGLEVDSDAKSLTTVVEPTGDHRTDPMPNLSASVEPIITSSKSINLDDLPLHSPSSQIVGTPFANDNTRFEYPFPDTNQTCDDGSSSAIYELSTPSPSASPSSNSFPVLPTSFQIPTQLSFPPSNHPSYNTTHPKMKVQANPPIPPNLIKRRLRWSLNLLGRRQSSTSSQQSTTSVESPSSTTIIIDGQQSASPPGSPLQEC